jgi:ribosomal-protein-alanine N-acetyltransferase
VRERRLAERLEGARTAVRAPRVDDAKDLLALRLRNRAFIAPWDPSRPASFFTLGGQRAVLGAEIDAWREDRAYAFVVCERPGDRILGRVTLDNVARGAFENAMLGYWIDEAAGGRGHATEAARLAVRFAFEHARLHRVQAAALPRNARSRRVLGKAGFRHEGRALRYLQIAGVWEDHDLFAITAEEHREPLR